MNLIEKSCRSPLMKFHLMLQSDEESEPRTVKNYDTKFFMIYMRVETRVASWRKSVNYFLIHITLRSSDSIKQSELFHCFIAAADGINWTCERGKGNVNVRQPVTQQTHPPWLEEGKEISHRVARLKNNDH